MGDGDGGRGLQPRQILAVSELGFGPSLIIKYGVARPGTRLSHIFLKGRAIVINRSIQRITRNDYTTRVQPQLCWQVGLRFPMTRAGIDTGKVPDVPGTQPAAGTEIRYIPAETAEPARLPDGAITPGKAASGRFGRVSQETASLLVVRGFQAAEQERYQPSGGEAVPAYNREPAGGPEGVAAGRPARLVLSRGIGPGETNGPGRTAFYERILQPRGLVIHSHTHTMAGRGDVELLNGGRDPASLSRSEERAASAGRPAGNHAPVETAAIVHREQAPDWIAGEDRREPAGSRASAEGWQPAIEETVYQRPAEAASNPAQQLAATDLQKLSDHVYRQLEQRLKMERQRKGW